MEGKPAKNFLLQPGAGGPVCWRWHTCQRYKHSFQGGGCWILGAKEISRLTYKHRLLFYFSLFPHTGGRVNKMLRLQWTGGLWRRLWEMKRAPLYRICAFLMSAGALIHSSFLKWEAIQTSRHWEAYIGNQNLFCTLKNTCLLIVYIEEKVLLSILF